jgi:hypothetical protein
MIGNIFGQLIGNSVASDNQYQQSLQHQMQLCCDAKSIL